MSIQALTDQAIDGRRLARAVRPQQAQQLTFRHAKPAVHNSHILLLFLLLLLLLLCGLGKAPTLPPLLAAWQVVHLAQTKDLDQILLGCPSA